MSSLICCRAPESNRRRLDHLMISSPQDFRHVSHYGDLDFQSENMAGKMSSKCGEGVFSESFHLECIDLKEVNGEKSESEKSEDNQLTNLNQKKSKSKENMTDSFSYAAGPPKCAPPPPPSVPESSKF